ncbi:MAG: hypothetical protein PUC65_09455 [Clostridiales bacterium]|nr:hypothetical protein [Clostridiales bacterium]
MKKVKTMVVLILALIVISIYVPPAFAAVDNTEVTKASDISSGAKAIDYIEDTDLCKYYKYTANESGYVNFTFERNDFSSTDSPKWYISLYDARMNEICNHDAKNDAYITQTVIVNKGTTYYLKVEGYNKDSVQMKYSMKANYWAYPFVEEENNDTATNATKLADNEMFLGSIISTGDKDFYKITASKSGVYTIHFDRHDFTSTNTPSWYFTLYDSNMNQLFQAKSRDYKEGINFNYVLAKGKSIYIGIEDYTDSVGETYELKASFVAKTYIETEKNDSFSSADSMKTSTSYCGVLATDSDSDYFVFKAGKTGTYKASYSLVQDITYAHKITVYDASRKKIKVSDKIYKNGAISFKAKKGKKYYVVVEHADNGLFGGSTYGVMYKLKAAKKK